MTGKSDPYARVGLGLSPKLVSNKSMKKTKVSVGTSDCEALLLILYLVHKHKKAFA